MTALIKEMKSARTIEEIFDNTRIAVAGITGNRQVPTVSSSQIGNVTLGPAASARVSAGKRLADRAT
jgi:hypothetical protein